MLSYKVSIPHRYGKNELPLSDFDEDLEVSIPHRYGKNLVPFPTCQYKRNVSIPHRYGKNGLRSRGIDIVEMFPFLIGTVRTLIWIRY